MFILVRRIIQFLNHNEIQGKMERAIYQMDQDQAGEENVTTKEKPRIFSVTVEATDKEWTYTRSISPTKKMEVWRFVVGDAMWASLLGVREMIIK